MKYKIKSFLKFGIFILSILLIISLLRSTSKILGSNQKLIDANKKLDGLKKENQDLVRDLQSVKSVFFVEQEARNKLGLAKKGEIVVILPDESILRSFAPKLDKELETLPDPNWKKWLKLFL